MRKSTIFFAFLILVSNVYSAEFLLKKINEYKKEIGYASGIAATSIIVWKCYQSYLEEKNKSFVLNQQIRLLKSVLLSVQNNNLELLGQSKNKEIYYSNLKQKIIDLNEQILSLNGNLQSIKDLYNYNLELLEQSKHNELSYIEQLKKSSNENSSNINLILQLQIKFDKLNQEYSELQKAHKSLKISYEELDKKNDILEVQIHQLEKTISKLNQEKDKLELAIYKMQKEQSLPEASSSSNIKKQECKDDQENEAELHEVDSFENLPKEYFEKINYQEIQSFIDYTLNMQADSSKFNKLVWFHYLLNNYRTLKSKILEIKQQLNQSNEDSDQIFLKKIIQFDEKLTFLKSESPWVKGKNIFNKLITNKMQYIYQLRSDKNKHLSAIVDLIWYFYYLAAKKDQDFCQGAFRISFENDIIYKFLCSYESCYDRAGQSSHLPDLVHNQKGIDIPEGVRETLFLPKGMTHILFGLGKDNILFIKPEEHGNGNVLDSIKHTYAYAISVYNRLSGLNEANNLRKERIPLDVIKAWKKVIKAYFPKDNDTLLSKINSVFANILKPVIDMRELSVKYYDFGKSLGICEMLDILKYDKIFEKTETNEQKAAMDNFNKLIKCYDNKEIRIGNEVILSKVEFGY